MRCFSEEEIYCRDRDHCHYKYSDAIEMLHVVSVV